MIYQNGLVFELNQKHTKELENRNKTRKERERRAHLGCLPAPEPAQLLCGPQAQPTTVVVLLAPVGQACGCRARSTVPPSYLPAWSPEDSATPRKVSPLSSGSSRPLQSSPSPLPHFPPNMAERCRRLRSLPPRSEPPPRLPDAFIGPAASP